MARIAIGLFVLCFITACTASLFLQPYHVQSQRFKSSIVQQRFALSPNAESQYPKFDRLLYWQELARVHQLQGQYEKSVLLFKKVIAEYKKQTDKAFVSAGKLGTELISTVGNEKNIPYLDSAFERVLVHYYQALNYLLLQDLTAANVEIRNAALIQRQIELSQGEISAPYQAKAKQNGFDLGDAKDNRFIKQNQQLTGNHDYHNLNAFIYLFSGLLWQAQGDLNAAKVDFAKAQGINPSVADLLPSQLEQNQGRLVVIFEQGFVAMKSAFELSLPNLQFDWLISIALPYYAAEKWPTEKALSISIDSLQGNVYGQNTRPITIVSALAAEQLQQNYPVLIMRQALRVMAKKQLQEELSQASPLAGVAANIYSVISEQADLRSWSTLPHSLQFRQFFLPQGPYSLGLNFEQQQETQDILIKQGETTVLWVVDGQTHLIVKKLTF